VSSYETEQNVEPAHISTLARARKQWRREGIVPTQSDSDFFRDDAPEVVSR
jgi:hypothetical protein